MIKDQHQRDAALDPTQSFIVQAPAGSGKTTLLTQRMLVLLAQAEKSPEEIIAITFTRKSAREMQTRIIDALQAAQNPAPTTPAALHTWQLAKKVLERDKQLQWDLLKNPNRLRIQTIDSLCLQLVQQAPVLSRCDPTPHIAENASEYYLQAAHHLLKSLNEKVPWLPALENVLLQLDNQHERAAQLFASLLAQRDQWLPFLFNTHKRKTLEENLAQIITQTLEHAKKTLPENIQTPLHSVIHFAATHVPPGSSPLTVEKHPRLSRLRS